MSNQGHTMMLHTTPPYQCPYQVSPSYTLRFPRYSPDKILWVKVTTVRSKIKSRSHHDVANLQPLTNVPSINFLHLMVSEIQAGQTFSCRPPAHPDTMGENNTPTALKGCGVKSNNNKQSVSRNRYSISRPKLLGFRILTTICNPIC